MAGKVLLRTNRTLKRGEAALEDLHDAISGLWTCAEREQLALPAGRWRLEFVSALSEIVGNVVRHAQPDEGVRLEFLLYHHCLQATLLDCGKPFEKTLTSTAAVPPGDVEALSEGGYGLHIARSVLDTLEYSRLDDHTNRWVLVKGWQAAEPAP